MSSITKRSWTAVLFGCLIGSATPAMSADRTAPEIIKELDASPMPEPDLARRAEPGYVERLRRQFIETGAKRDVLILELYKLDPDNARLPELMKEHWRRLPPLGADEARLKKEIDDVLARTRNDALKTEAFFARAFAGLFKTEQTGQAELAPVDDFVRKYPKDERSEQLLYVAFRVSPGDVTKKSYEARLVKEYPDSKYTAAILGARRQAEGLGKPFELEFTDAITGSPVSTKEMKGKVIVIDFWATWCAPCVAEMPHLKALYERYHKQGVEFIGVSLDEPKEDGGLDRLKSFVKQRQIPWPQYYQGNGWESPWSRSWGVNAIPAVFLVDADGNLHSVQAQGKLDQMIPELLAKKANAARNPASGG